MYILKNILINVTISLLVGLAGVIGTKLGFALWDKVDNKKDEKVND